MHAIVEKLLTSPEPSVRFKVRVGVLCETPDSPGIRALQEEVRTSPRVGTLLGDGEIHRHRHLYAKWKGAHWVLLRLADIGYPAGDDALRPVMDRVLECWLHPDALREYECTTTAQARRLRGVPIMNGRARRCASQQGNALYSATVLGFLDERAHRLVELLARWQWPDGGWNCDRNPGAAHSSFWESLIPLRGLAAYARVTGDGTARRTAERAAELFLRHRLFRRESDGSVMNPRFVRLHYPCYWRYDILCGLKVMAEAGFISDPRCNDALDLLESKRLPDGGWPAEERFYTLSPAAKSDTELVNWGPVSRKRMNEWVTADALRVLKAAGRLNAG
ncbi:MAG TPA: hypothetical protein PLE60_01720 [Candidatus Latescibacteria bacterium]|nr:hypothetical protein [Candidatus Latescibacterota bacterium]